MPKRCVLRPLKGCQTHEPNHRLMYLQPLNEAHCSGLWAKLTLRRQAWSFWVWASMKMGWGEEAEEGEGLRPPKWWQLLADTGWIQGTRRKWLPLNENQKLLAGTRARKEGLTMQATLTSKLLCHPCPENQHRCVCISYSVMSYSLWSHGL